MESARKKKNRSIEFWRFLFTVFVVLFHMQVSYDREPNFLLTGTYAVEFFFCLSGYLLAASFRSRYQSDKPALPQIGQFALSRLKKFVPMCWLFLFLSGAYHVVLFNMVGQTTEQLLAYVKNLWPELLLLNGVIPCANPANGPTWYISSLLIVSIVYYVLYIFCRKVKWPWPLPPAVISVTVYFLCYWGDYWFITSNLLRGFCCMGFGMCLCALVLRVREPAEKCPGWFWQIVQLGCLAALVWVYGIRPEDLSTDALVIPLLLLLLFTVFGVDTPLNRLLDNPVSEALGEVSFVMYLSHILLLTRILWHPNFDLHGNIVMVYTKVAIIVFAFSLVAHYLPKIFRSYKKAFAEVREAPGGLVYPDALCVVAVTCIIILQLCGDSLESPSTKPWQFIWLAAAGTVVQCAVPLLVMRSGMTLLSPEKVVTRSQLFKKYISSLAIAYVGWSAVYTVFTALFDDTLLTAGLGGLLRQFIVGTCHLRILPMMMVVFLTTPIFRRITEKKDSRLLWGSFVVLLLINVLCFGMGAAFSGLSENWVGATVTRLIVYPTYFFAGYCLSRWNLSKAGKFLWLGVLVVSAGWSIRSVFAGSAALGALDESKWSPNRISMVLYTISVFMSLRHVDHLIQRFPKAHCLIRRLSELSFVIFLCHDLFATILANLGFTAITRHPVIFVPVLTILILISSIVLSEVLLKIKNEVKEQGQRRVNLTAK